MNNTIFAVVAVMAAAALLAGALVIAPASATSGDGNTITKLKNKGYASASGFGTISANVQANAVCFVTATCV